MDYDGGLCKQMLGQDKLIVDREEEIRYWIKLSIIFIILGSISGYMGYAVL